MGVEPKPSSPHTGARGTIQLTASCFTKPWPVQSTFKSLEKNKFWFGIGWMFVWDFSCPANNSTGLQSFRIFDIKITIIEANFGGLACCFREAKKTLQILAHRN